MFRTMRRPRGLQAKLLVNEAGKAGLPAIFQSRHWFMTQITQLGKIASCLLLSLVLGPLVIFGAIKCT